ncbi:MAG: (2Fe-2S) ferredoxin domain-containing protein [Wenzhouxiangellaceae bacterium]|nr:MAG: (2Fe-2S) ferredoxin domain-containing protein [Wenzhouxiangellaceae bacterium]
MATEVVSFYRQHLFFCTNQRPDGADRPSCGSCDSAQMRAYVKARVKELGLAGAGQVRVNTAGCLDRCEQGPCLVVYPDGIWYTFVDEDDLDEIIQSHLVENRVVERLRLPDAPIGC